MIDLFISPFIIIYSGIRNLNKYECGILLVFFLLLGLQMVFRKKIEKGIKIIKDSRYFSYLLLGSFLFLLFVKFFAWFGMQPESSNSAYLSTLKLYTSDALKHFVVKPPLTDWYNAFWMNFFEVGFVSHYFPFVLMIMSLNLLGVYLLGKACDILKINRLHSYPLLLLLSLFMTPYEVHRGGYTYDHLMFVCSSYFFYSLVNFQFGEKLKERHLSLSLVLIIFQSSIYLLIGPVLVFVLIFLKVCSYGEFKAGVFRFIKVLSFPLVLVSLLIIKNHHYTGLVGTSSIGGPTLMLVVQKIFDKDKDKLRDEMVKYSVPDWYLWCFDNYKTPLDPTTGKPYPNWDRNTIAFGICTSMGKPGTEDYPFNFSELSYNLRENGFDEIAKIVEEDVEHQKIIPHIRNTLLAEASSLWMVKHGQQSIQFAKKVYQNDPDKLAKTFLELQSLFMKEGPFYVEKENLKKIKIKRLRKLLSLPVTFLRECLILFYPFAMFSFLMSIVMLFSSSLREYGIKTFIVTAPIFLSTYIFNTFSGEENHRYFVQIIPFVIVFASGFLSFLYRGLEIKFSQLNFTRSNY